MNLLSDTSAKSTGPTRICRQHTATTVCLITTAHLSKSTKQQQKTEYCQLYKVSTPRCLCMAKQAVAKPILCVLWCKQQRRIYSTTSDTLQVESSNCCRLSKPLSSHQHHTNRSIGYTQPHCSRPLHPCRQRIHLEDVSYRDLQRKGQRPPEGRHRAAESALAG